MKRYGEVNRKGGFKPIILSGYTLNEKLGKGKNGIFQSKERRKPNFIEQWTRFEKECSFLQAGVAV
jgi:hypothetical protein